MSKVLKKLTRLVENYESKKEGTWRKSWARFKIRFYIGDVNSAIANVNISKKLDAETKKLKEDMDSLKKLQEYKKIYDSNRDTKTRNLD